MHLHMNAADVREMVIRLFVELGADHDDSADLQENIRIDRGRCVARCYRATEMFAMWLIDCGVVQFYNADGEMLHTVNLSIDQTFDPNAKYSNGAPKIYSKSPSRGDSAGRLVITDKPSSKALLIIF